MTKQLKLFLLCSIGLLSLTVQAQNPSLEFTINSRVVENGPTLNSGAITFYGNSNNPTGTDYAAYNPALTATFSIDSIVFPTSYYAAGVPSATNSPVSFGYTNAGLPILVRMSYIGDGSGLSQSGYVLDNYYTSSASPTGTGIAAQNANTYTAAQSNYGVEIVQYLSYLDDWASLPNVLPFVPLSETVRQADLTITFNRPVNNPILHITGFGGASGGGGRTASYELIETTASTVVTLSKLSGSLALNLDGNSFYNGHADMEAYGVNGCYGSILISGKDITTVKFRLYIKSNGLGARWSTTTASGDAYTLGLSVLETDLAVTNTVNNTTPAVGDNVTFTIVATNNGISNSTNTGVSFVLPAGYTFVSSSLPPGTTYDPGTGLWTIGNLANGASTTLTIVATVTATNNYTSTATISGDNGEPDYTNNTDDANVTPLPVMFGNVSATYSNGMLLVNWRTETEINNSYFDIEVSADGKTFKKIQTIQSKAQNGFSTTPINYEHTFSANTLAALLALPSILGLLLLSVSPQSRKRYWILKSVLAIILISSIGFACSKDEKAMDAKSTQKIFVRIAQVDKDGKKAYSKVIQATNE